MGRNTKLAIVSVLVLAVAGLVVWGIASGGGESGDPGAGNPESKATAYKQALADAPPPLKKLYANGDQLIQGGADALHAQLEQLHGYPVVVNVWASWCGPCRLEFPDLQSVSAERGDEVAFVGVDAEDSDAAATDFLAELPLPYPSVTDPDNEIKDEYALRGYPATAFYNSDGERVYVKQGPYTSAEQLNADIDKYAG
ncbi:MAG: cytochrome c biosis protein CcmG, thiol:disulfide interchange protein DsbE [Solirubrobacterales bacterium]|jgi:cytochrome c biogenesis protein CcmG/thiol:disulfide interchange protein DsbE|nr:cytochrome c biosis protein CcmG, thiol:disulfide interchange protein DsbE [Solirubrobacterales bacterium]